MADNFSGVAGPPIAGTASPISQKSPEAKAPRFKPRELHEKQNSESEGGLSTSLLGSDWLPIFDHECDFGSDDFFEVLHYLVRNPNINSSTLFRADILYDSDSTENVDVSLTTQDLAKVCAECPDQDIGISGFDLQRSLIRRFVPRNESLDRAINQSVLYYKCLQDVETTRSLLLMIPHVDDPSRMPYYHPCVAKLAFLYSQSRAKPDKRFISIHYKLFPSQTFPAEPLTNRQIKTARNLLETLYKHGQGNLAGYKKRVHHDQIIDQKRVQDRFAKLKREHARRLLSNWVEVTDSGKQVFEQIGIAAFLLELWKDMYAPLDSTNDSKSEKPPFPGFVDVGCGNGILVELLLSEGYSGWGGEGHRRKTWATLKPETQRALLHAIVVPAPLESINDSGPNNAPDTSMNPLPEALEDLKPKIQSKSSSIFSAKALKSLFTLRSNTNTSITVPRREPASELPPIHNGIFLPKSPNTEGPFLISNHADELTAWTPLLASLTVSSFLIIPCCSRNLSGEKFRAPSHANNYTADDGAPGYFNGHKMTVNGDGTGRKKHIAIPIPISLPGLADAGNGIPGSPTSAASDGASEADQDPHNLPSPKSYSFINAPPPFNPSPPPNSTPPSNGPTSAPIPTPPKPTHAAEIGDLRALSQKSRKHHLSAYQALCNWIVHLADACGYLVEREMLRVPSTRNFGIVGRFVKGEVGINGMNNRMVEEMAVGIRRLSELAEMGWDAKLRRVLSIIEVEGGASHQRWMKVCERDVVKGGDLRTGEHG